jgi:DNA invertase Pin-like site-specific DNA recombinase
MNNLQTKDILHSEIKILIYCRESVDNYGLNYERIETQRDMLIQFCKNNGYTNIVDIIMHNDVSGTDFSRFDDIKRRVINKEIDAILMKDDSRLGRNQIESLKFVDFLDEHGVELIFESEKYNEDLFPLKAYFNERRAKEDSIKIKRVLRHKMEEGALIISAPFGYKKEGKKLIIDENVSWIICKIYDLYLQGYGYHVIAKKLNEEKIISPSAYKNNHNLVINTRWGDENVRKILINETYAGNLTYKKTDKPSFKSKKVVMLNRKLWKSVDNTHDPIISIETFDKVQKMIEKKVDFSTRSPKPSKYSGYIICGRCKKNMFIARRNDRGDGFTCGTYLKKGKYTEDNKIGCFTHHISEEKIENIIKQHITKIYTNKQYKENIFNTIKNKESCKTQCQNTINKLEQNLNKLQHKYKEVYNDKLNEIIPEFLFKEKSLELNNNISIIEKQINDLKKEMMSYNEIKNYFTYMENIIEDINKNGLTKKNIDTMLENIIIFWKNEITENDKLQYNIVNEEYEKIKDNGGILIRFKNEFMHNILIQTGGLISILCNFIRRVS